VSCVKYRRLANGVDMNSYVVEKILGHDFAKNVRLTTPSGIELPRLKLL
jgi:hypothetical protein